MPRLRLTNKALKPAAYLAIASFIVLATGCSTSKDELLPHGFLLGIYGRGIFESRKN